MKTLRCLITGLMITMFLISCVPSRKYEQLKREKYGLQTDYSKMESENRELKELTTTSREKIEELTLQSKEYKEDLDLCRQRYDELDRTNRDLIDRYERMLKMNENMASDAAGDKQELMQRIAQQEMELSRKTKELNDTEDELRQREKDLERNQLTLEQEKSRLELETQKLAADKEALENKVKDYEGKVGQLESNVGELQGDLAEREKRVKELESVINSQKAKIQAIEDKVNKALLGISKDDLSVTKQDGKLYVSLSQNLLFSSGSTTVNSKGKDALVKLSGALKNNPDLTITVEGHTDSDGQDKMNWDLSVKRATSVIDELMKNGVSPRNVIASGRGEHFPVATNDTSDGKAKNRRIEIILSPDLKELYDIVD